MKTDIVTTVILPLSLFIIMYGMGLSLRIKDFINVGKEPKAAIIGVLAQLFALPIIAFITATVFKLSPELAVGLMIISFAPGGATSNLFTNLAKGDTALSISLTAVVSLIIPFTLPLFTVLSMNHFIGESEQFTLPLKQTILQLIVITIIPVALGMFTLSKWEKFAQKIDPIIRNFSVIFLLLIIVAVIIKNKSEMGSFFAQTGLASLSLNAIALCFAYLLAKVSKLRQNQSITIAYEVGIQNGTLALMVTGTLIGNTTMMIPTVTYTIFMFITGFLFSLFLRKRPTDQVAVGA